MRKPKEITPQRFVARHLLCELVKRLALEGWRIASYSTVNGSDLVQVPARYMLGTVVNDMLDLLEDNYQIYVYFVHGKHGSRWVKVSDNADGSLWSDWSFKRGDGFSNIVESVRLV